MTLGWIAVKSRLKEDLLERLGLEIIGDVAIEIGEAYALTETPEGWSVVVFGKPPSNMDEIAAKGAPEGSSLCGVVVENVTFSEVRGYENGRRLWSVERDPGAGPKLVVKGHPPAALADIEARCEAEQAEADNGDCLFDAPIDLADQLTGYYPASAGLEARM